MSYDNSAKNAMGAALSTRADYPPAQQEGRFNMILGRMERLIEQATHQSQMLEQIRHQWEGPIAETPAQNTKKEMLHRDPNGKLETIEMYILTLEDINRDKMETIHRLVAL